MKMPTKLFARGALGAVLVTGLAFGAEPDKQPAGNKPDADGVRRDPKGIKGISPFWEAIKKGDDQYIIREYDAAAEAYKEALTQEPQNALGHYRLGEAYVALGKLDEAQASYESAKRFSGEDKALKAKVLFVLADLQERKRELDRAKNDWSAYESYGKAESATKTYPETPADRKKRIDEWKKLEEQYAEVKKRIAERLEEADKKAKGQ